MKITIVALKVALRAALGHVLLAVSLFAFADTGVELYKKGVYVDALQHFNQDIESGDRRANTFLYKAMSLYKLERYQEAKSVLMLLEQSQVYTAKSRFNLALTELKLGNEDGARYWFNKVLEIEETTPYHEYADKALSELQFLVERPLKYSLVLRTESGYEDLSYRDHNQYDYGSTWIQYSLYGTVSLGRTGLLERTKMLGLYLNKSSEDPLADDIGLGYIGLSYRDKYSQLTVTTSVGYSDLKLNGDDYYNSYSLSSKMYYSLSNKQALLFNVYFEKIINASPLLTYESGERYSLELAKLYILSPSASVWRIGLEYGGYDHEKREEADNFFLVGSPRHVKLSLLYKYKLTSRWSADFLYQYRKLIYDQIGELDDAEVRREDNQHDYSTALKFVINKNWTYNVEARYSLRNSNVDFYDKDRAYLLMRLSFITN